MKIRRTKKEHKSFILSGLLFPVPPTTLLHAPHFHGITKNKHTNNNIEKSSILLTFKRYFGYKSNENKLNSLSSLFLFTSSYFFKSCVCFCVSAFRELEFIFSCVNCELEKDTLFNSLALDFSKTTTHKIQNHQKYKSQSLNLYQRVLSHLIHLQTVPKSK